MMDISAEEKPYIKFFDNFTRPGEVVWISIRPEKGKPVQVLKQILAQVGGLLNDHSNRGNSESKRQVTLIQQEHLQAAASFLGKNEIDPALVRRNILVKGLNLNSLAGRKFAIGEAVLEMTGFCPPCQRMEENLGTGGYNAMRGHGGITCKVLKEGKITIGDKVSVIPFD
jgi:MOSC domain-containing protein YiiM